MSIHLNVEGYDATVTVLEDGTYWLRCDVPEDDPKDNWTTFCLIQQELRERYQIEIINPCIEYDCISGNLQRI